MPNLQSLIARGSLSAAESTYNTYSNSARASMSTGAYPEVHGNAGYYLDRERDVVVSQNRDLRAQTINQALAETGRTTGHHAMQLAEVVHADPAARGDLHVPRRRPVGVRRVLGIGRGGRQHRAQGQHEQGHRRRRPVPAALDAPPTVRACIRLLAARPAAEG
jgi:hypothetical protein